MTVEINSMNQGLVHAHYREWRKSRVHPKIIEMNVRSYCGQTALELMTETAIAGVQKVTSYITAPAQRILDKFAHVVDGGWWVSGLDPLNQWQRMEWGQFKPDRSRAKPGQPSDVIKYESPYKAQARCILLEVPAEVAGKVYRRYGIAPTEAEQQQGFWHCVWLHNIPIVLCEGAKKAGLLLSLGYAAIALPGIWMARRKQPVPHLIPEIEYFATAGRVMIFCFDQDWKTTTRQDVARAIKATSTLLAAKGCHSRVALWYPDQGKGIDDVVLRGNRVVQQIMDCTETIENWIAQEPERMRMIHQLRQRQEWAERQQIYARRAWQHIRSFTPSATVQQQYVDVSLEEILQYDIYALKSDLGTGKTEAFRRLLQQWPGGVIIIGYRNSLLLNQCSRFADFYHLHEDNAFGLIRDPNSRIACCVESLVHFYDQDFDGKLIIIDESQSLIKHGLQSSTLNGRRERCLQKLSAALQRGRAVLPWDGNNSDTVVDYMAQLRGEGCRVYKLNNEHQAAKLSIELVSTTTEDGQLRLRDQSPVLQKIYTTLESAGYLSSSAARAIVILSDSQRLCQALDRKLSGDGYRVLRIDSKTVSTPAVKQFLCGCSDQPDPEAPDRYLASHPIDVLILSPTAESGINIAIKQYFFKGFAFFHGIIDSQTQKQFLRRVRDCCHWMVWCQEYTTLESDESLRSPFVRHLHEQLIAYLRGDAECALEGSERQAFAVQWLEQVQQKHDSHLQTYLQFAAARNYERTHTRACFQQSMIDDGHEVTVVEMQPEEDISADIQAIKHDLIESDAQAIFAADDIPISEALRIRTSFSSSVQQRFAAEKAFLKLRLPGIETTSLWSVELVKRVLFTERHWLKALERYWMITHLDVSKAKACQEWSDRLEQDTVFLPDVRSEYLRLQALNALSIPALLESNTPLDERDERIQTIYRRCQRSKPLQTALGRKPGKQSPMRWVNWLISLIGGTRYRQISSRRTQESRLWQYCYDAPLATEEGRILLDCIERRYRGSHVDQEQQKEIINQGDSDPSPVCPQPSGAIPAQPKSGIVDDWMTPDSLDNVRSLWQSADTPEAQALLQDIIPPPILQVVLERQDQTG